ncbi:MAG: hydroxyacid dehydrogenase [Anaerolineae bacterium]
MDAVRVLVTVPQPLRDQLLTYEALAKLTGMAQVILNDDGRNWTEEELAQRLPGIDALITGWGIVRLTAEVLERADHLRIVAHSAGSVKGLVSDALFDRGIVVTSAASRIADSVAEFTLLAALVGLRRPDLFDRQMKEGTLWPTKDHVPTYEIAGKRVGLLGMGHVGRKAARLFQAVKAEVWAYDPYLSSNEARSLGVHKAGLDELLATCPVVSVHLPVTEETHHALGRRELGLMQNGAILINTARAWVVDQEALVRELATGRLWAALDVFEPEPLPEDHSLRRMPNVLLTPHLAGMTRDSYAGLMALAIDEVGRFLQGEPLHCQITRDMLPTIA